LGRFVKSDKSSYSVGVLFVFAISFGVAAIIYGAGFLAFDPLNLMAFIFSPLGIYTLIYALKLRRDRLYYLSWGLIMSVVGGSLALYRLINVVVLLGLLLIFLAAVGLLEYWRRR